MGGQKKSEILLAAVIAARSTSNIFSKICLQTMAPFSLLSVRFTIAFLILALLFRKSVFSADRGTVLRGAALGGCFFLVMTAETFGLRTVGASTAALVENTAIVFVPLFAALLRRRLPRRADLLCAVIALAGAALVILRNGSVDLTGDIRFCILAALLYTAAILLTSVLSKQGDALVTGIFQVGFMALFSTAASFLSGTPQLPQSGTEWACILMLAVVCSSFGFALQPLAQRGTTPERTGLFCAINPLVSALLAAVFLHEDLGIAGVAGMALILLSICISGAVSARQARCS